MQVNYAILHTGYFGGVSVLQDFINLNFKDITFLFARCGLMTI